MKTCKVEFFKKDSRILIKTINAPVFLCNYICERDTILTRIIVNILKKYNLEGIASC